MCGLAIYCLNELYFLIFILFDNSNLIVCDPTEEEELNSLGYIILGTNNFKEVTAIHITGKSRILKEVVLKCCTMAWERTNFLMEFVKKTLDEDKQLRTDKNIQNNLVGFVPLIKSSSSNLFTFSKEFKQIVIEELETKDQTDEIQFEETYNTRMYRFKDTADTTDVITEENEEEDVKNNWKNSSELIMEN